MKKPQLNRTIIGIVAWLVVIGAVLAFVFYPLGVPRSQDGTSTTSSTGASAVTAAQEQPQSKPEAPKTWQTVATLTGENSKRGEAFEITSAQQRLTYTVSDSGYDAIYVYVMEEGRSLDRDGGISEVTGASASGDTIVYRLPGRYYLDINGFGTWTVTLEELR